MRKCGKILGKEENYVEEEERVMMIHLGSRVMWLCYFLEFDLWLREAEKTINRLLTPRWFCNEMYKKIIL